MSSEISEKHSKSKKTLIRGIIYAFIASVGLIMEILILKDMRPVIIFGYSLIFLIAMYYIFILRKKQDATEA